MTIYTLKEYAAFKGISTRTLSRRIEADQLPDFVKIKKLEGRGYVLWTDQCELCKITELACREYSVRDGNKKDAELATEIAMKYDLKVSKMFRLIGL